MSIKCVCAYVCLCGNEIACVSESQAKLATWMAIFSDKYMKLL